MLDNAISFLDELRRRRVIRVTVAYCALAWVLLDVSDTLLDALGLPAWTVRLVVALLLLGLPVTVMLAWAFDLTPGGVHRTPPRERTRAAASAAPEASRPPLPAPTAAASPGPPLHPPAARGAARPGRDGRRVVVALPFVDRSPAASHQYLGDGITEELINGLASVPGLHVVSRTSAFAFRGQDLDVGEIGRRLGACCAVEGSVRVVEDRLRLTVQLVDVAAGVAVWSARYDRRLEDVFEVEQEVARSLVAELRQLLELRDAPDPDPQDAAALAPDPQDAPPTGRPWTGIRAPDTRNVAAYEKYLRGRAAWNRRTPGSLLAAIGYFDAALALDPGYAHASAGLADAWALLMEYGHLDPLEGLDAARPAVARALRSAPALAETQTALGLVRQVEWRWDDADVAFRRATELNPGYSPARQRRALLMAWLGRPAESQQELDRALRLDPLSPAVASTAGWLRYYAGDPADALDMLDRAPGGADFAPSSVARAASLVALGEPEQAADLLARLRESADSPPHLALHGWALGRAGRVEPAREAIAALDRQSRTRYVSAFHRALPHLGLGSLTDSLDWLDRARAEGAPQLVYLGADPMFDPLREQPRFQRIVSELGLAPAAATPALQAAAGA